MKNLFIIIALFSFFFCSLQVNGSIISVGPEETFTTIQSAINSADAYDIIQVGCGFYDESVQVLKPVKIFGVPGCTILSNSSNNDIMTISADNCTISGLTIKNCINDSYSGLFIRSNGNLIENNEFINNSGWGIYLYHCQNNSLMNNTFTNDGICMIGSKEDWLSINVSDNTVLSHPIIWLKNKQDLTINSSQIGQLILVNSTNCLVDNITISSTDQGIVFAYTENSTIKNSDINQCRFGIRLQYAQSNTIKKNTIHNNIYGLYITHSNGNMILNNIIQNNKLYGSYFCCNSKQNIITQNKFINNTQTAYDYFENTWFFQGIGNYYSDYLGNDNDNDGIGDSFYQIPPEFGDNIDSYPVVDFEKIQSRETEEASGFPVFILLISILIILSIKKRKRR